MKKHPFIVPENYFEQLPQGIKSKIISLKVLQKNYIFRVPQKYFEQLPKEINSRINPQKINAPFTVPDNNYFDNLAYQINKKINTEKEHKKVIFYPQINYPRFALASVIILLGFGYLFLYKPQNNRANIGLIKQSELAKNEKEILKNTKEQKQEHEIKTPENQNIKYTIASNPTNTSLNTQIQNNENTKDINLNQTLKNAPIQVLVEYVAHEDIIESAGVSMNDNEDLLDDEHWDNEHNVLLNEITEEEMKHLNIILKVEI